MLSRQQARGFTLIELLVAMTIVGVLIGLGAPAMSTYLQNAKVGSATQAWQAGLQMARTEAIRRNLPVQFITTSASVASSAAALSAAADIAGQNWVVRATLPDASSEVVDVRSALEGEASAASASVQVAATASGALFSGAIVFNGFGGTDLTYVFDLSNPRAGTCAPGGPVRCRRVIVYPGGQVKACDPAVTATSDSRSCLSL